ncbi:MAG: iron-sulfur cluster repair di-iron protein [Candidatus Latescibacteria bacterium]|jgi:regulator of cell morphogenesis and NO signaling|nr:iron-sulfur cluster repair di-iron protein [Candidatus Latescibacterota bacterium]
MSFTVETTVGKIATEYPLATRVFARHKIDYCCGGGVRLDEVCEKKGLNTETIIEDINKEIGISDTPEIQWDKAPLANLIDHILVTYHRPLDEELPRLEAMVRKVANVHGAKDPEMFSGILSVFLGLNNELVEHMMKEEQILFPMIKSGQGAMAQGPVSVMMHEHDSAGAALTRLRELTNDFRVPQNACNTWRALWHGLAALETALHDHIHLENNILFPRALSD